VLVNISASKASFQLQEMYDVMSTIKAFSSDSAHPIIGTVYDDALGDQLRVTIIATGLGKPVVQRQSKPLTVVASKTGTDNQPLAAPGGTPDYGAIADTPAVFRKRDRAAQVEALANSGVDKYDIPAFLRKQAD